ncbi:MAG: hypothetical protein ACR2RE_03465, partial [Geminicoccaceae bacterium]
METSDKVEQWINEAGPSAAPIRRSLLEWLEVHKIANGKDVAMALIEISQHIYGGVPPSDREEIA